VNSTAAVDLAYEMWEPILVEARERGELRPDLDFRAIATWITYLTLLLIGRGDIEPDVDAQRELLRTFVTPAFRASPPLPAKQSSPPDRRGRPSSATARRRAPG
jgi:hypothetical protein